MKKNLEILIVEDDHMAALGLKALLSLHGKCDISGSYLEASALLSQRYFDIVFLDLNLNNQLEGLDLIPLAVKNQAYTIVLSGLEEERYIEESYLRGCRDYLVKPFDKDDLDLVLKKFTFLCSADEINNMIAKTFVTQDNDLLHGLRNLDEIVFNKKPIFIEGPTGTGKTLLAKLIHKVVHKKMEGFVHLNCAEIPEALLESELFGHKKGSFTGANSDKKGKLELAHKGTLFLDEMGAMSNMAQKKLLKVIEDGTFSALGSVKIQKSEFRLISATCEDLKGMVKRGSFREDLYYRVYGLNIKIPPLCQRKQDVPLLINHFLRNSTRRIVISNSAMEVLQDYHWPGNVRELQKTIEILQSKNNGIVKLKDLPDHIKVNSMECLTHNYSGPCASIWANYQNGVKKFGLKGFIHQIEEKIVSESFENNDRKVRKTLNQLKMSNNTFYRIMERIKGRKNNVNSKQG